MNTTWGLVVVAVLFVVWVVVMIRAWKRNQSDIEREGSG